VAAARLHAGHSVLLHLDLKGFFPSVGLERVKAGLTSVGFTPEAADLITQLTTIDDCLPQGACTSVALGNLVLGKLDGRLARLCRLRGLTYTRYVDDIGISGGGRLAEAERLIRRIVADEGWVIGSKGGLLGVDSRHRYVGIVLNASPNLSSDYIKDLRFLIGFLVKNPAAASERVLLRLRARVRWVAQVNPRRAKPLEAMMSDLLGIGEPTHLGRPLGADSPF